MINAYLDQFLDNGWANESEIYYKGHIYWCECDKLAENKYHFFIRKWKAKVVEEVYYVGLLDENGELMDYDDSFSIYGETYEGVREEFLKSPVWEGKTFWEVEKELAWYEWYGENKYEKEKQ